jgi:hypothetical protein
MTAVAERFAGEPQAALPFSEIEFINRERAFQGLKRVQPSAGSSFTGGGQNTKTAAVPFTGASAADAITKDGAQK